jgi:DNA primase catalytic core
MTLHRLSAGDGYTYLTRQVAAADSTERGYNSLGDYYAAKGEAPGVWMGAGLEALGVSGTVTEDQMLNLFGQGLHPDADRIFAERRADGATADKAEEATKLGRKFPVYAGDDEWRESLAEGYRAFNVVRGNDPRDPVPAADKSSIRDAVANRLFEQRQGRAPLPNELTAFVAQVSRPVSSAVAGFDATFSPVKSISTLWAIAPPEMAQQIEAAHLAAVTKTLDWMQAEAAYTRTGPQGAAQVDVRGLVMAAFTHRDSRAGDPDLHTHVAIANKVQTLDGQWLSLDSRMMYRLNVAASEFYNTAMEAEYVTRLGGHFVERTMGAGKRTVRELAGVDLDLNDLWSSRRRAIDEHRPALVEKFHLDHGRLPTTVEMIALNQQANLATREAKHEPRSLAEQRAAWQAQALEFFGGEQGLMEMLAAVNTVGAVRELTEQLVNDMVAKTIETVAAARAQWRWSNLTAEAFRQVRYAGIDPATVLDVAQIIVERAVSAEHSVPIGMDTEVAATTPEALLRTDRTSQFTVAKGQLYTNTATLDAESRVVAAAGQTDRWALTPSDVHIGLLELSAQKDAVTLNAGQQAMLHDALTSGLRLQLVLSAAGVGKTTAMRAAAVIAMGNGKHVVGFSSQASTTQTLAESMPDGVVCETLDKLITDLREVPREQWLPWMSEIGPDSLVIVDEAGLASTAHLDGVTRFVTERGGRVLLVGDDQQRAASAAGGLLRDIESTHGALYLTEVMRFTDRGTPGEGGLQGAASLAMRDGDPLCLGFYNDRGWLHAVAADTAVDTMYTAWAADIAAGKESVMIAMRLDTVSALNARARTDRIAAAGGVQGRELTLPNGEKLSAGDTIITKQNKRALSLGGTDFVRNNYFWTVQEVLADGSVKAAEHGRGVARIIPAWYVTHPQSWVRLGYAHTAASVQGLTVDDTAHTLLEEGMTKNDMYPAMTRAKGENHGYGAAAAGKGDTHDVTKPGAVMPPTMIELASKILATDGSARSATTEIREAAEPARRLAHAGNAYAHSIVVGAQDLLGAARVAQITEAAETLIPGITAAAAWDTLRGHLLVLAADGSDPIGALTAAAGKRELGTADDLAAVLDFRLDPTGNHSQQSGPLPWLPAIPAVLAEVPHWAPYLAARGELVDDLATQIRGDVATWTAATAPAWAVPYLQNPELTVDLALWRASQDVPVQDLRPAGERPRRTALRGYHDRFVAAAQRVAGDPTDGSNRWATVLAEHGITIAADDYWPVLAARLSLADAAGLPVHQLLEQAITAAPLGAETAASALWWRLAPHLAEASTGPAAQAGHRIRPAWTTHLQQILGETTTEQITTDPLWPTLVAHIDRAQRDGIAAETVIPAAAAMLAATRDTVADHELAAVLLSQLHTLTDPAAEPQPEPAYPDPADADLTAPADAHTAHVAAAEPRTDRPAETDPFDADRHGVTPDLPGPEPEHHDDEPGPELPTPAAAAATSTPADLVGAVDASQARLYAANAAAAAFFTAQAPQSWVPGYVADRKLDPNLFGYAPAKWTALADHLRQQGFTDAELLAAGLGTTSRRGEVVDRFRDRAVLPITTPGGDIAAFIGRISPTHTDNDTDRPSPKYLNGPGTDIFSKRELPFGLNPDTVAALRAGADIVLVEGPMDALAITAAATAADRPLVPIATNGTALTAEHLTALNDIAPLTKRKVIEAFDSDPAGREAAFRAHTLLAAAGVHNAVSVTALTGKDPAQMLTDTDPAALLTALNQQRPLADLVVDHILSRWPTTDGTIESRYNALKEAAPHIAAMTHTQQYRQADRLTTALNKDPFTVLDAIAHADPIRTPAPNPTPTATADGLGLPTPPVLSAESAKVNEAQQASLRRSRLLLAQIQQTRLPTADTRRGPAAPTPAAPPAVEPGPQQAPAIEVDESSDNDWSRIVQAFTRARSNPEGTELADEDQRRHDTERENELDWD